MGEHQNVAMIREAAEKAERSGDMTAGMELMSEDIVWHEIGRDEPIRGKQALMERFQGMPEGATITTQTHDVVGNEEHVIQLVTATGTLDGQSLVYRTAEIFHVKDGKVTERWAFSDDTDRINKFFGGI